MDQFHKCKLIVIGDSILDQYSACEALGMSAEAPVVVVKELEQKNFIGGAALVAANVSSLGAHCDFISVVGSDENAKNLRRAFLKAPVKFSRISSRYNLKRRIAYYGNRVRPHKGTDFAASVGTPIMVTASGKVVKASYTRANGNYVTIKHNNTYSTQYLHMKKRKVRKGDFVKQGDIIGWVGMTGNTSGPHVCYRFWKNGRQVDPFKQKLPQAKPISKKLKEEYLVHMNPLKIEIDCVPFEPEFLNYRINTEKKINNASE